MTELFADANGGLDSDMELDKTKEEGPQEAEDDTEGERRGTAILDRLSSTTTTTIATPKPVCNSSIPPEPWMQFSSQLDLYRLPAVYEDPNSPLSPPITNHLLQRSSALPLLLLHSLPSHRLS